MHNFYAHEYIQSFKTKGVIRMTILKQTEPAKTPTNSIQGA